MVHFGLVHGKIRWLELARSAYLAYYLLSMLELLYNSKIDVFCKNFANIFAQNLSFSRLLFGPFWPKQPFGWKVHLGGVVYLMLDLCGITSKGVYSF